MDATLENKEVKMCREYNIIGWPTIIFLGPNGQEYKDLRVVDYDASKIEVSMREAIER